MTAQEQMPYTWGALKEFCNSLSEEQLSVEVGVDVGEVSHKAIAVTQTANLYIGEDAEDIYDEPAMTEAEEAGEARREDYRLQPAGTPFLTTEF